MSCFDDFVKVAPAVSAIASAIAACAAWANVAVQNRNVKHNRGIDIFFKKEAEFDSPRFIKHRGLASKALLEKIDDDLSVEVVLNFMETVAKYEDEGHITAVQVWEYFYDWFAGYYYATEEMIKAEQIKDKSVWSNLVRLQLKIENIQAQKGKQLKSNLKEDILKFLNDEVRYAEVCKEL